MKIIYYDEKYLNICATAVIKHYNNDDFGCNFTHERARLYLNEIINKPRFIGFLLLDKEVLVGFALCHLKTWDTTDELAIDEFIISEHYQEKGLGTRLLDFISTYSEELNLSGITTFTNVIPLSDFYRKNDFIEHDISFLYKGFKHS